MSYIWKGNGPLTMQPPTGHQLDFYDFSVDDSECVLHIYTGTHIYTQEINYL